MSILDSSSSQSTASSLKPFSNSSTAYQTETSSPGRCSESSYRDHDFSQNLTSRREKTSTKTSAAAFSTKPKPRGCGSSADNGRHCSKSQPTATGTSST